MMDQPRRSNELGAGSTLASSDTKSGARQLGRTGAALGLAALVVLVWSGLTAHHASAKLKESTQAAALITVATTQPAAQSQLSELSLPGSVQANYEAPIYARTSGYLKRWLVDIGTPVKAGQLLAEIESPEVDQQLRQSLADLTTAEANQHMAGLTAERWRNLRASDSVSKQEADEKISLAASGDAQMQAARANVQRLREMEWSLPETPISAGSLPRARILAPRCSGSPTCTACACT